MANLCTRQATAFCGIAVVAKASKAGRTKTRLTPHLTPADAARLNTAFLKDCASNLLSVGAVSSIKGYFAYGPPEEVGFFDFLPPEIGLVEAWTPDFGETLKRAMAALFARGHAHACLLNADGPTLPPATLIAAAEALAAPGDRLVLGPSTDGGYYLIGMKRLHRRIFEDVAWSTEIVTRQTIERAGEIGLEVTLLHPWYDVDDEISMAILRGELIGGTPFDPTHPSAEARHTRALLNELDQSGAPA